MAVEISEKISNNKPTGKLALTFYVEKKISLKRLRADQAIPATVPEVSSGSTAVPTDVVVIGKIKPETNVARKITQHGNVIGSFSNQPKPEISTLTMSDVGYKVRLRIFIL